LLRLSLRRVPVRHPAGQTTGILEVGRLLEWSGSQNSRDSQLRLATEQMPGLVWVTDRHLRIVANWGCGLPGTPIRAGALVGKTVCEFLGVADPYATPIAEHHAALTGKAAEVEFPRKQRVLEIRLAPLRSSSGEVTGCIGLAADITHRKAT